MRNLSLSLGLVAFGANLPSTTGSASETLHAAINTLHDEQDISISALSRFWQTPAVPAGSGPDFVNATAAITTSLHANEILDKLHRIEANFGRDRGTGRWSARVLDLDLLAFGQMIAPNQATLQHWMDLPPDQQRRQAPTELILPHPRLQDRGFVLAPLAEIAPLWRHPLTGLTVVEMLSGLSPDATAGMSPLA
ncbi:2-amino-4-hydroxy-6-hydroxymethyldihydropteridine diphosphokinase [Paracoccus fistulariae]|uniref:2-amino-4-hydroxy-6-hydroxymethyldihydropteridine pyrophosphokinase n=1 Tax=Paracoccus fistulariae TaxID=658446 RepID=A0ABY7SII9_9RHOB|nr:2-amino-4-hydroxy-6-hydroxymethyldihydropteridine diphosphokinase [Paracoccus fistulariae]MDB6182036.1 2-amino-4-hydroxy-6-hydroxymethyldihydropteridine diphosphokinase [Paracoccus fistulariae]WCR06730.1 2-amino-4-hydroxy-6-hydroxymethyldihydropteridine diphosphokinase [Paracoccus fistulariae]